MKLIPYKIRRYWLYQLGSRYHHGHRVHSPFVFDLITNVLEVRHPYYCYEEIEPQRRRLKRRVRRQCLPRKYAQMLFRLVNRFQPKCLLEFGQGDGLTAQYLGRAARIPNAAYLDQVTDAAQVRQLLEKVSPEGFCLFYRDLSPQGLQTALEECLEKAGPDTVLVVFGIRDNRGKARVWQQCLANDRVTLSLDMNRVGLVFFRPEQVRRCYLYRY